MLNTIANVIGLIVGLIVGVSTFSAIFSTVIVALKIQKVNNEIKSVSNALDKYVEELKI